MLLPEEIARARIYGLLARLLAAPPDAALLEAIARADDVSAENALLVDPWLELAYAAAGTDVQALDDEYQDAYCRSAASRLARQRVVALCSTLCRFIATDEADLEEQSRFLNEQLVPAAERLRRLSSKAPPSRFYRHVGHFAAAFFRVENIAFGEHA